MGYQITFFTDTNDDLWLGQQIKKEFDVIYLTSFCQSENLAESRYLEVEHLWSMDDGRLPFGNVYIFRSFDHEIDLIRGRRGREVRSSIGLLTIAFSRTDFSNPSWWQAGRLYACNFPDIDYSREMAAPSLPVLSDDAKKDFEKFRKSLFRFVRKKLTKHDGKLFGESCLKDYNMRATKPFPSG